jgi:hypothetical protein
VFDGLCVFLVKEVSGVNLRFTGFFEVLVIETLDDNLGVLDDEPGRCSKNETSSGEFEDEFVDLLFLALAELEECEGDLKLELEVELIGVDVNLPLSLLLKSSSVACDDKEERKLVLDGPQLPFCFPIISDADVGVNVR